MPQSKPGLLLCNSSRSKQPEEPGERGRESHRSLEAELKGLMNTQTGRSPLKGARPNGKKDSIKKQWALETLSHMRSIASSQHVTGKRKSFARTHTSVQVPRSLTTHTKTWESMLDPRGCPSPLLSHRPDMHTRPQYKLHISQSLADAMVMPLST